MVIVAEGGPNIILSLQRFPKKKLAVYALIEQNLYNQITLSSMTSNLALQLETKACKISSAGGFTYLSQMSAIEQKSLKESKLEISRGSRLHKSVLLHTYFYPNSLRYLQKL